MAFNHVRYAIGGKNKKCDRRVIQCGGDTVP